MFFRQIKHIAEVFEYLQTSLGEKQYARNQEAGTNDFRNRIFAMFHLTTSEKIKADVCSSFRNEHGIIRVVLCSTSFSMGLDVKGVHTVVHYGPANDTDDYLQESGRAGRDPNVQCNAVLLKYKFCMNGRNIAASMKEYVTTQKCRREVLLSPFIDASLEVSPCHSCCDICTTICRCLCHCNGKCTCLNVCCGEESDILTSIRMSVKELAVFSEQSSESECGSDIDFDEYQRQMPTVMYSSDELD